MFDLSKSYLSILCHPIAALKTCGCHIAQMSNMIVFQQRKASFISKIEEIMGYDPTEKEIISLQFFFKTSRIIFSGQTAIAVLHLRI